MATRISDSICKYSRWLPLSLFVTTLLGLTGALPAMAIEDRYQSVLVAAQDLVVFDDPRIVFVTENGGNTGAGASAESAVSIERALQILSSSRQDLILAIAAGRYLLERPITLSKWRSEASTAIIGAGPLTQLTGPATPENRNTPSRFPAFRLGTGNVVIANLKIESLQACVAVASDSISANVVVSGLSARDVGSCVFVDSYRPKTVQHWRIENLKVTGFHKAAIRLSGKDVSNILIRNATIDGETRMPSTECHKTGIDIRSGAHGIRVSNALIANVFGACGEGYQQGDGLAIDSKGGPTRDIILDNIRVVNARDGGFDIKGANIVLRRLSVLAEVYGSYAFRLWPPGPYRCQNCGVAGNYSALVFARETEAVFENLSVDLAKDLPVCDLRRTSEERPPASVAVFLADGQTLAPTDVIKENSDQSGSSCLVRP